MRELNTMTAISLVEGSVDFSAEPSDSQSCLAKTRFPRQIFDNNCVEILTADELAARLKVKVSWIVDHCSRAKTRDPLPVLRIGKHRRFRWGSREMDEWLDRRVGIATKRKAGQ